MDDDDWPYAGNFPVHRAVTLNDKGQLARFTDSIRATMSGQMGRVEKFVY